jgi:hypothetical protein
LDVNRGTAQQVKAFRPARIGVASWDHFTEGNGGNGVVTIGSAGCKFGLQPRQQYTQHLCKDALPGIIHDVLERTAIAEN